MWYLFFIPRGGKPEPLITCKMMFDWKKYAL